MRQPFNGRVTPPAPKPASPAQPKSQHSPALARTANPGSRRKRACRRPAGARPPPASGSRAPGSTQRRPRHAQRVRRSGLTVKVAYNPTAFRNAAFIRPCQPGPSGRKRSITSRWSRSVGAASLPPRNPLLPPPLLRYIPAMPKLSPIESEFESTEAAEAHDRWVRAKVAQALAEPAPSIPHDQVMADLQAVLEGHARR